MKRHLFDDEAAHTVIFFTVAIGLQLLVAPTGVVILKRHATFLRKYVAASLRVSASSRSSNLRLCSKPTGTRTC